MFDAIAMKPVTVCLPGTVASQHLEQKISGTVAEVNQIGVMVRETVGGMLYVIPWAAFSGGGTITETKAA